MDQALHNHELEQGLISWIMTHGLSEFVECSDRIGRADLHDIRCQFAWTAMESLAVQNLDITLAAVAHQLRASGLTWPELGVELPAFCLHELPPAQSIPELLKLSRLRRIEQATTQGLSRVQRREDPESIASEIEAGISDTRKTTHILDGKALAVAMAQTLEARVENAGSTSGVLTGFPILDRHLGGGIQLREQTVVAARTSVGKSAFGSNVAVNASIRNQVPTLFVTYEMDHQSIIDRIYAAETRIPLPQIKVQNASMDYPPFSEDDHRRLLVMTSKVRDSKLFVLDCSADPGEFNIDRLCSAIKSQCHRHGIKLVVIDYLGKIPAGRRREERTLEVAEVSQKLKSCAVATGAAFLTLCQLNRQAENEVPQLHHLAECGQIERDADVVLMLYRPKDDHGQMADPDLFIRKNRNGPCFAVRLSYDGPLCKFSERTP